VAEDGFRQSPGSPGAFFLPSNPMNADLERLIKLQRLDDASGNARRRIEGHPERVQWLNERLDRARQDVAAAKKRLSDSQGVRRAAEKDLAVVQGRLTRFKDQVMEVKTNREFQAMQKEIETAQNDVADLEDKVLEKMLEADELSLGVEQAEQRLVEEETAVAAERASLEDEVARLEAELTEATIARQLLTARLDPRLLALFEQIAQKRKGVAVAEARDGHCAMCYVRLRPQVFNEIRRNDAIIACESCQRILYFPKAAPAAAAGERPDK
jgi:uncharacterized protein